MTKLLLLLLALSSVTHQRSEPIQTRRKTVTLDFDLEAIIYNTSTATHRRIIHSGTIREKRQANASVPPYDNGRLAWLPWTGSIPSGAVSISNTYEARVDYVCKHGCYAGFYSTKTGSKCLYPLGNKEVSTASFEILVNKNSFDILEWKAGSGDSVAKNSVRTCRGEEIYVGKNQYGLGEMIRKQKLFFLPWHGSQYSYGTYETLTIKTDIKSELIDNVAYKNNSINIFQYRPQTLLVSTVSNNNCYPASKVVSLSKTINVEHKWDVGSSIMAGIKTFTGGIPHVIGSQVKVSAETRFQLSRAYTMTEEVFSFMSVALEVPPNSRCKVHLMGHKFNVKIPFAARLGRTDTDNKFKNATISGTYSSIQVGNLHAKVEPCQPISEDCHWIYGMEETQK